MPPTTKTAPASAPAKAPVKTTVVAAPAPVETAEVAEKTRRPQLSPEEAEARCQELITQLYSLGRSEEEQATKRKLRGAIRRLDKDWRNTYASFIETNWPSPVAEEAATEEAPAPAPAAPAKAPAKAAVKGKGK